MTNRESEMVAVGQTIIEMFGEYKFSYEESIYLLDRLKFGLHFEQCFNNIEIENLDGDETDSPED